MFQGKVIVIYLNKGATNEGTDSSRKVKKQKHLFYKNIGKYFTFFFELIGIIYVACTLQSYSAIGGQIAKSKKAI